MKSALLSLITFFQFAAVLTRQDIAQSTWFSHRMWYIVLYTTTLWFFVQMKNVNFLGKILHFFLNSAILLFFHNCGSWYRQYLQHTFSFFDFTQCEGHKHCSSAETFLEVSEIADSSGVRIFSLQKFHIIYPTAYPQNFKIFFKNS